MKPPNKETRFTIGLTLIFLALLCVVSGASIAGGVTGAFISAGICLAIYAIGFFVSSSDE